MVCYMTVKIAILIVRSYDPRYENDLDRKRIVFEVGSQVGSYGIRSDPTFPWILLFFFVFFCKWIFFYNFMFFTLTNLPFFILCCDWWLIFWSFYNFWTKSWMFDIFFMFKNYNLWDLRIPIGIFQTQKRFYVGSRYWQHWFVIFKFIHNHWLFWWFFIQSIFTYYSYRQWDLNIDGNYFNIISLSSSRYFE